MKKISCLMSVLFVALLATAQQPDSIAKPAVDSLLPKAPADTVVAAALPDTGMHLPKTNIVLRGNDTMTYHLRNGYTLIYPKPKSFGFITNIPTGFKDLGLLAVNKKSLPAWAVIVGTSALTIWGDQWLLDNTQQFMRGLGIAPDERYKTLISVNIVGNKSTKILEIPQNLNTVFYEFGKGYVGVAIGAGLYAWGAIKKDYRAKSTAAQLMQVFLMTGITTQLIKRTTGRETPLAATQSGGRWYPLPTFSDYQGNQPRYDAFPSGHLATMMATITVLAENYPEKKWIRPVGYSLMGLCGLAMMNNGVHWAGDYPLGVAVGYGIGKVVSAKYRIKVKTPMTPEMLER
jgi:membrane-associated phospholipid phosphatase